MSLDMVPLVMDTGASVSLSPDMSDFVTLIHPTQRINIKGIASG
jgi:hypothetical protein